MSRLVECVPNFSEARRPAVVAQQIPTPAFQALVTRGAIGIDSNGAYMVKNWAAFNAAVTSRSMVLVE